MPQSTPQDPTSVYRYFDAYGLLLYVGITKTGVARNRQHNNDKEWWNFVASQEVDHCPSQELAHVREIELIRRYLPPFNNQHNPEYVPMRTFYIEARRAKLLEMSPDKILAHKGRKIALRLVACDEKESSAEFVTELDDAAVACRLRHVPERRVFIEGTGLRLGCISAVRHVGPFARIFLAQIKKGWRFDGAIAHIRNAQQKDPTYEVRRLFLTNARRAA